MIQPILNSIQTHFPDSVSLPAPKLNGFQHSLHHFALPGLKVVEIIANLDQLSITTYKLPNQLVLNEFIEEHAKSGLAASIFNYPSTTLQFGLKGELFAPVAINNVNVSAIYGLLDSDGVVKLIG